MDARWAVVAVVAGSVLGHQAPAQEPSCDSLTAYVDALKGKDQAARLTAEQALGVCGEKAKQALSALTEVLVAQQKRHAAGADLNRLLKLSGPILRPEVLKADEEEATTAVRAIRQILGVSGSGLADLKAPGITREAVALGRAIPSQYLMAPYVLKRYIINVSLTTPYLRVALAASEAAEKSRTLYVPFVEPTLTPAITVAEIEVRALSSPEGDLSQPADNVEHIIVMKAGGTGVEDAIQPIRKTPIETEAQNKFGVKRTAKSMIATFPVSAFVPGNEVRVVYSRAGAPNEQRHPLEAEALSQIR